MMRIPSRWRWLIYWASFTAAFTLLGWAAYGVLDWLIVAMIALIGAVAVSVPIWREDRRGTAGHTE